MIKKIKEMTLNEYQKAAMKTCLPKSYNTLYMLSEIAEECGELQGKFAKAIRHGNIVFNNNDFESKMGAEEYVDWIDTVLSEMGDILWGVAGLAEVLGFSLETVCQENLEKLASRKNRGKIDGSGDKR